jgi:hypothetical protein
VADDGEFLCHSTCKDLSVAVSLSLSLSVDSILIRGLRSDPNSAIDERNMRSFEKGIVRHQLCIESTFASGLQVRLKMSIAVPA